MVYSIQCTSVHMDLFYQMLLTMRNSPNRACSIGVLADQKREFHGCFEAFAKSLPSILCKDLYYFLHSGIKKVQIMQGFIGCRKVPPHFVQGFILFFAFGRLRKSSKSAKPRKTCVNCSFLRSPDQITHVFKGFLVSGRKNVVIT